MASNAVRSLAFDFQHEELTRLPGKGICQQKPAPDATTKNSVAAATPVGRKEHQDETPFKIVRVVAIVEVAVKTALYSFKGKQTGKLSQTDRSVMSLNHLPMCPKTSNKVMCNCVELAFGAAHTFQDEIRALYCCIVEITNHSKGNEFLLSMMIPTNLEQLRLSDGSLNGHGRFQFSYQIPAILDWPDNGKCRVFYVCAPQFQNLFGMSKGRMERLHKQRKKQICSDLAEKTTFEWRTGEGNITQTYRIGRMCFSAFRSEHWLDFVEKHH